MWGYFYTLIDNDIQYKLVLKSSTLYKWLSYEVVNLVPKKGYKINFGLKFSTQKGV